jgi:hypothetical protein
MRQASIMRPGVMDWHQPREDWDTQMAGVDLATTDT